MGIEGQGGVVDEVPDKAIALGADDAAGGGGVVTEAVRELGAHDVRSERRQRLHGRVVGAEHLGVRPRPLPCGQDAQAQAGIEKRLKEAGYKEPQSFVLEHGYCRSVYATDPNGMIVEFTRDHPDVEKINRDSLGKAHSELKRWLAGDHTSNNNYR